MTVLAATGNSVGKVLQKQAAGRLPRLVLRREVVGQFLGSRLYMLGMACDLVGALLVSDACVFTPTRKCMCIVEGCIPQWSFCVDRICAYHFSAKMPRSWSTDFILIGALTKASRDAPSVPFDQSTHVLEQPIALFSALHSKLALRILARAICHAVQMVAAFAHAPVSVVQPVSAVGLVILLVFSHFYLAERLRPAEWLAAAIAGGLAMVVVV
eukprot:scaffold58782_cov25-Tisochrysis_lutea.AAC.1